MTTYTHTSIWDFDNFELFVSVAPTTSRPVQCRDGDSQISLSSLWMRLRDIPTRIHQHSAAQQKVESSTSIKDASCLPSKLQKDHKIILSIFKKYEKPPHKLSATIYHRPKRHWVLIIPQFNHTTSSLILHKIPLKFQYIRVELKSKYHKYHVYIQYHYPMV